MDNGASEAGGGVVAPRLLIAATRKSSGKTVTTIGLAAALVARGYGVQLFKKGPDFIDPMWHRAATGRPGRNLDHFMMTPETIVDSFIRHASRADISLIEGNLGLFDGQDLEGSDSSAGMANQLDAPVVLVIDVKGMARGVAPLINGHTGFPGGGERIAGVILNNVASQRAERRIRAAVERFCDVPVLGVIPRSTDVVIDERHLGLVPVEEDEALQDVIKQAGDHVGQHLDLDAILSIARAVPPLVPLAQAERPTIRSGQGLRIGYAADAAFNFYYQENLERLSETGIELIPVSFLDDQQLPRVDGLFIGGGFPEMFMERIAANRSLHRHLREAARDGLPIYAECGGLMVLGRSLRWQEKSVPMTGVLPFDIEMCKKPQGYGYMVVEGSGEAFWPQKGEKIACHEFHYSRVINADPDLRYAYRVLRGSGVDGGRDGILYRNVFASYAHIHAAGTPSWVGFLVDFWRKGGAVT
ncbi:MAG: hydrogenobyrinic acid a,c-diamide synthase (glutamine-hydrolyzing) [Magnetococcales bacterium]|nr:hydrogenobyrinic acid a,c-diamide synthase (glutamine-hydrolyzing) [Magnetococcales bacterium]